MAKKKHSSAPEAVKKAADTADKTAKELKETVSEAEDTLSEAAENAAEAVSDAAEAAAEKAENAAGAVGEAAEKAADKAEKAAEGAAGKAEDAAEEAAEAVKKIDWKKIIDTVCRVFVPLLIFLAAAGITIYYVTTAAKGEFHADCTDTLMWANATVESGHYYDQSFTYACFLPFGTSTVMIPLIHMFGLSMTAHVVGMMIYFLLLTVFMLLMFREITGNTAYSLIGTAIFLSITLSTEKMREIFWGHTIYYTLGPLFLVIGAYLYVRFLKIKDRKEKLRAEEKDTKKVRIHGIVVFVLLCLFMFFTGMDGITGFTLFILPFVGAIFAEQFLNKKTELISSRSAAVFVRVVIFLILAVLGNKFNSMLLGKLVAGYQDANSNFSAMDTWLQHLQALPFAWMKLLGVQNIPDMRFTSKEGVNNIIMLGAAGVLAVMPIIATCFYPKYGDDRKGKMLRIWVWMHWAVTAVNLMGYIFGGLSAADWRIIPMIATSIILSLLFTGWTVSTKADVPRIALLLMIPVIAAGAMHCMEVKKMKPDNYKKNVQYAIADFLTEQGVTKGYATFWNANSVTVITDNKVKVSDVTVNENGVFRRDYQSSSKWYETDPEQKEYFLLLSSYEYDTLVNAGSPIINEAVRTSEMNFNGLIYKLFVYDHNIV